MGAFNSSPADVPSNDAGKQKIEKYLKILVKQTIKYSKN